MKNQRKAYMPELAGLDLLRFLLSITVMVFHYYFFYHHPGAEHHPPTNGPFQSILFLVYKWGFFVVQIFWLLSGFIFYTVYFEDIQDRKVGIGEYLMLRLSRLYPLHLLTLLLFGCIQLIFIQKTQIPFWYDTQDAKHLFLQLLFMQSWYPDFQQSFNVPAWSVSLEIFVYVLFFLVAASGVARKRNLYVIFALSVLFYVFSILGRFSECMMFFFGGNIAAKLFIESRDHTRLFVRSCCLTVIAFIALVLQKIIFENDLFTMKGTNLVLALIASALLFGFILTFKKIRSEKLVRLFKSLGDLTYATYMLHYSIIAAIVLIVGAKDPAVYDQNWILPAYLVLTIGISWLFYKYFEKPAQQYIRRMFYNSSKPSKRSKATVPTVEGESPVFQ